MVRELKPHGTEAAYRRHKRRGEDPCEECRRFKRENSATRRAKERPVLEQVVEVVVEPDEVDALAEAVDSLRIVRAALHSGSAPMNTIASLTKRRDELVDRIKELQGVTVEAKVSVVDELTSRRARRSNTAG